MATTRKIPRSFEMHWGSGEIVEEASTKGEWHEPAFQLLQYTSGEAAGRLSVRFCYYDQNGRFQRSPLMLNEDEILAMRAALRKAPRLLKTLRRLVD